MNERMGLVDRLLKSNRNDQFFRQNKSYWTRSRIFSTVEVSPRDPFTCAQPVIPGRTLWRIM
jgi:hypothetical protein